MTREGTGSALISSTTAAHCSLVLLLLLQRRSAPQIEGRTKHLTTAKRTRRTTRAASASATRPPDPALSSQARPRPRSRPHSPRPFALRAARSPRSQACPSLSLPPSFGLSVSLYCERALGPLIAVRGTTSMRATAKLSCSAVVPRSVRARQGPRSGRLRGVAATRLAPARQRHDTTPSAPGRSAYGR